MALPELKIVITAATDKLDKGLTATKASMAKFADFAKKAMKIVSAAIAAAAAALVILTKKSFSTIDAQAKLAKSLGTTTASIQILARAGELAGVSMGSVEQATKDLQRRLSQAAAGGGPAADALKLLRLNAEDLLKLDLDDRVDTINRRIKEFIPAAQQAAVAGQLFGEEGSIAISRIDSEAIKRANEELTDLGVLVSEIDAKQIERTNDAWSAMGLVLDGIGNRIAIAIAPAMEDLANWFGEASKEGNWLADAINWVIKEVKILIDGVVNLGHEFDYLKLLATEIFKRISDLVFGVMMSFKSAGLNIRATWTEAMVSIRNVTDKAMKTIVDNLMILEDVPIAGNIVKGMKASQEAIEKNTQTMSASVTAMKAEAATLSGTFRAAWTLATQPLITYEEYLASVETRTTSVTEAAGTLTGTTTELTKSTGKATEKFGDMFMKLSSSKEGFEVAVKGMSELDDQIKTVTENMDRGFENALASSITNYKNAGQAVKQFAATAVAELLRVLVIQKAVAAFGGGGGGGIFGGLVKGAFSLAGAATGGGSSPTFGGPAFNPSLSGFNPVSPFAGYTSNFEGGGYTGNGPRSGGLDGKGGFMAMVHPRERINDDTRASQSGSGAAAVIHQTFTIAQGVTADTVQALRATLLPEARNAAMAGVADARRRGGNKGRSL